MTIASVDGLVAAAGQDVNWAKTASMTTVAGVPFTVFAQNGYPGAGTLAGTSTTTGVVPVDTNAGFPLINAFGGGNTGEITAVAFTNTVACRLTLYDLLWKGGAYAFNASTSGNTPASYASRLPGTDYTGLEIWMEQVTAGTGLQSVNVTYTNESGTTGRTTGVTSAGAAAILGRMTRLPLQAGDKGVQGVTGVAGSVATAGTFNILVMRKLATARINSANDVKNLNWTDFGAPQIYDTSALYVVIQTDGTSSSVPEAYITIKNG